MNLCIYVKYTKLQPFSKENELEAAAQIKITNWYEELTDNPYRYHKGNDQTISYGMNSSS